MDDVKEQREAGATASHVGKSVAEPPVSSAYSVPSCVRCKKSYPFFGSATPATFVKISLVGDVAHVLREALLAAYFLAACLCGVLSIWDAVMCHNRKYFIVQFLLIFNETG